MNFMTVWMRPRHDCSTVCSAGEVLDIIGRRSARRMRMCVV